MKEKIKALANRMQSAVRRNPVEVVLAVLFCVVGCVNYELPYTESQDIKWMLLYYPVIFLLSYLLNTLAQRRGKKWKLLYYVSIVFFIPFFFIRQDREATYFVSLVVIQLLYLTFSWEKDNLLFIRHTLKYLQALLFAGMLATVAWLLAMSVLFSLRYIFDSWILSESRFMAYAASVAYIFLMPLLFLMFNENKSQEFRASRLFEVLLNYVLSPALLVYAVILYVYFIKIVVLWSLPKGAVAYIVISFVSAAFILKGCQPLLRRQYYGWFYHHVSWYAVPALIMYWIGIFYRIRQYGYTEDRVYLVVLGCFLTLCILLFFSRRWGRYLYLTCSGIFLLSVFTYIPGISARDLGIRSQMNRLEKTAAGLELFASGGKLSFSCRLPADTVGIKEKYHALYESFGYLARQKDDLFMLQTYGVSTTYELLDSVIPPAFRSYALTGRDPGEDDNYFILYRVQGPVDVTGFRMLYPVESFVTAQALTQIDEENGLMLEDHDHTVYFSIPLDTLWNQILKQNGLSPSAGLTQDTLQQMQNRLLVYNGDSIRLLFDRIQLLKTNPEKMKDAEVAFFLHR